MFFLVYVSAAVTWFSDTELRTLLGHVRSANQAAGITGLLLYKDGNFMQVLEGEEAAVRTLYARIAADRRHCGLVMLDSGHAPERQFAEWSMAFFDLNAADGAMPAGYSDFLDTPLTGAAFASVPSRWWQMLLLFRQME